MSTINIGPQENPRKITKPILIPQEVILRLLDDIGFAPESINFIIWWDDGSWDVIEGDTNLYEYMEEFDTGEPYSIIPVDHG